MMAIFHLRRFSQPGTLKKVDRRVLVRFLAPYREFFRSRSMELPTENDGASLDIDRLLEVLMSPDTDTPDELANALYFVHEMATPEALDQLLEEPELEDVGYDQNSTPAEVAMAVWLRNRDLLERKHAEHSLIRPTSFEYFQSEEQPRRLRAPSREALAALEQDLDNWFESKLRGRGCRVFVFPKGGEVWFLVRHGDPFKREASLKDGQPSGVFYRPEKNDVVVYNPDLGELRMNAGSKGERALYRAKFGLHLFGHEEYFPGEGKYTLEPLRERGPASIVCTDVDGLDWVVLKELQWVWGGPQAEVETRKAKDLFAAFEARNGKIPPKPRLRSARFEVKFIDAKRPRMVTVRPSNIAKYTRDPDNVLIEQWLTLRGFSKAANAAA
jgi:hypothetical protein